MEQVQIEEGNPFDEFPREIVEDVEGLTWLGHLEEEFEFCGHNFVLRTLKADEELMASALVKEYTDSIGAPKAWAWANIALALVSVDGEEDFCPPVGPDRKAHARARFQWVTQRWYWPLGEYLFARFANLVQRQKTAIEAVQDLSTRSLRTSMPSVGSSTVRADSPEEEGFSMDSNFGYSPTSSSERGTKT